MLKASKLPSRFQLGDYAYFDNHQMTVVGVAFGLGHKVRYDLQSTKNPILVIRDIDSVDVNDEPQEESEHV